MIDRKRKMPLTIFFLSIPLLIISQEFRKIEDPPFQRGEYGRYRVFYDSWLTSGLTAGVGTISIREENKKFHGRDTYHIEVIAKSVGLFNWFFKVRDVYESWVDTEGIMPWYFYRNQEEGSYTKEESVEINQAENWAESEKEKIDVPPYVQDIVSAFYYMRTLDFSDACPQDEYFINFVMDDSVYHSKIIFLGKEIVKTKMGKFRCLKFKPMVAEGAVFDEPYPMTLWVTDDVNHVPVLGKSAVIVGSITLELTDIKGLKYPMDALLE
ncbi:MAG: DUF3108 domain-containing protein [Bacteroidales bacterium]